MSGRLVDGRPHCRKGHSGFSPESALPGAPIMTLLRFALALALWLAFAHADSAVAYKIVTASERGTYIQIGRDLAKFVAPDAEIDLEVLPSVGSAENVQRLRYEP